MPGTRMWAPKCHRHDLPSRNKGRNDARGAAPTIRCRRSLQPPDRRRRGGQTVGICSPLEGRSVAQGGGGGGSDKNRNVDASPSSGSSDQSAFPLPVRLQQQQVEKRSAPAPTLRLSAINQDGAALRCLSRVLPHISMTPHPHAAGDLHRNSSHTHQR